MNKKMHLTRRHFLMGSLSAGAVVFVAACAPKQPPAPAQPEAEKPQEEAKPAPVKAQEINWLCGTDIKSAYAADKAVERWNADHEAQVVLSEPPAGAPVDMKIQAAQAAGDLVWDGYSGIRAPIHIAQYVSRDLIVPWDPFFEATTVPNADKILPAIVEPIKDAISYEGKMWCLPGNIGSRGMAWAWEPLRQIGMEDQPYTWDGVYEMAKKLKEARPDLIPFGFTCTPHCDLWPMIWSAQKNPYDENGLIDIRGEWAIEALKWIRRMVEEDLMYTDKVNPGLDQWLKQAWATCMSYDVAGTMAQQSFGVDKYETGIPFFPEWPETNAGTVFLSPSASILNKARNPQGWADFMFWLFGPDNKEQQKQMIEVASKPAYLYTYDEFAKGNPQHAWQVKAMDLVARSVAVRRDNLWGIQNSLTPPYIEKVYDKSLKFEPVAWMEEAYDHIQEEIAKQK